ncbi:MAG: hypothetical protein PHW76_08520 [Alphaproteobacteria bacterium]|nr:hypothetical protein [Alphaproteobacteria bacterium]
MTNYKCNYLILSSDGPVSILAAADAPPLSPFEIEKKGHFENDIMQIAQDVLSKEKEVSSTVGVQIYNTTIGRTVRCLFVESGNAITRRYAETYLKEQQRLENRLRKETSANWLTHEASKLTADLKSRLGSLLANFPEAQMFVRFEDDGPDFPVGKNDVVLKRSNGRLVRLKF